MKKIPLLLVLTFVLYSCMPSNIHIMEDYKGKKIKDENLMIVETRLDKNGYTLLNEINNSGDWERGLELAVIHQIPNNFSVNSLFDDDKDTLLFKPSFFDIAKDIEYNSTFKNVANYLDKSLVTMSKQSLLINENDPIEMFLPSEKQSIQLADSSVNYLLFIQFPKKIYAEEGKIVLNINFCFWDRQSSKIISYGRFDSFTAAGYKMNTDDLKYELIRRILIETPFYKGKISKRANTL